MTWLTMFVGDMVKAATARPAGVPGRGAWPGPPLLTLIPGLAVTRETVINQRILAIVLTSRIKQY